VDLLHESSRPVTTARVVVVGAESTGTTTLVESLCTHFQNRGGDFATTTWVPEFGRDYTIAKLQRAQSIDAAAAMDDLVWGDEDFVAIAREQNWLEDLAAEVAGRLVLCDTDAFATSIWQERYLGHISNEVRELTFAEPRVLYILTSHVGVDFDADEIRDGEHLREWMTDRFREELQARSTPWIELDGRDQQQRLALAVTAIDKVIAS